MAELAGREGHHPQVSRAAPATATRFEKRTYAPIDAIDEISCRPDFAVMCYSGYLKAKDKDELAPGLHIPAGIVSRAFIGCAFQSGDLRLFFNELLGAL